MNKMLCLSVVMMVFSAAAYADINPGESEGASAYDWEACVSKAAGDCSNACSNSEDINCQDKCTSLGKDKCKEKGLQE